MIPSTAELLAAIRETIRLQVTTSRDGRRLKEMAPATLAALTDRIARNVAQYVDGLLEEFR